MKNKRTLAVILVGSFMFVLIAAAFTPSTVYAEIGATDEKDPSDKDDRAGFLKFFDGLLSRAFGYQKSMVRYLGRSLEFSEQAAEKAQKRITRLRVNEEDVTILEEALDKYYDLIGEARKTHNTAESLVELHDGFDDDGLVENFEKARETVSDIEPNISNMRNNIIEAARVIHKAIQSFQDD